MCYNILIYLGDGVRTGEPSRLCGFNVPTRRDKKKTVTTRSLMITSSHGKTNCDNYSVITRKVSWTKEQIGNGAESCETQQCIFSDEERGNSVDSTESSLTCSTKTFWRSEMIMRSAPSSRAFFLITSASAASSWPTSAR